MSTVVIAELGALDPAPAIAAIEAAGHRAEFLGIDDPAELPRRSPDCTALIVATLPLASATLSALPSLRVVATSSVGYDHIDTGYAETHGITVCNVPSIASEEVAVHALAGALSMIRALPQSARQASSGRWSRDGLPLPPRVSTLAFGLVGIGRIATALAERALPLFRRVVAYDPFVSPSDWPEGVGRAVSLEELLSETDVLSLHTPATPRTRRLIGDEQLQLLPRGAYLVNVARGELVDPNALVHALDTGHLRGAFLDVVDPEPPAADSPLLSHPQIVVTPHTAYRSEGSLLGYLMHPVENVLAALAGQDPPNRVTR